MGLRINPAPAGFKSPAVKDIESTNNGVELATEQLLEAVDAVHDQFEKKGFYDALMESDLYIKGNASDAKQC